MSEKRDKINKLPNYQNMIGKKESKQKESEREEGEKIIVKNAGKQNETELE